MLTNFNLATEIVVFAIFAIVFNLIADYGGRLSFGHAACFDLSAYRTLLNVNYITPYLYISIFLKIVLAGLASVVIG